MRILVGQRILDFCSEHAVSDAVAAVGRSRGHSVKIEPDGELDAAHADVILLAGNLNWFRKTLATLRRMPACERALVAVWHYEPLPPSRASQLRRPVLHLREVAKILLRDIRITDVYSNAWRIRREFRRGILNLVIVSTAGRREFLDEEGIPATCVPLGYCASDGHPLGLPRDIDVLFLGILDVPRRKKLIKELAAAGVNVQVAGDWANPAYWGERRTELLNRTKILLNLARTSGDLSGLRLIRGMANKALVVSEPIHRPDPFVPGEHFVMAPMDELPRVIQRFLEDERDRAIIVECAHRFVTTEHTMDRAAEQVLKLLEQAMAERAGNP